MATQTLQLDRQTRAMIADTIAKAVRQQMESYEERWVLAQELCELLPALSPDFLRRHGDSFPRKRFVVENDHGTYRSRFMYPLHRIERMISEQHHEDITI